MRLVAAVLAASLLFAAGCSSDDGDAPSGTADAGATTVPPSIVPLTTTTSTPGTPVADSEVYAQAGLTAEQGECIESSGIDGEFETTPGPTPQDAMVLSARAKIVALPPPHRHPDIPRPHRTTQHDREYRINAERTRNAGELALENARGQPDF